MPITNAPTHVDFDAAAATELAREQSDDRVIVAAEYTVEEFQVLYASDRVLEEYDDPGALDDVGDRLHSYMHVDFTERKLFEDLYPPAKETRGFVTYTDYTTVVRVLDGAEGLYLSFEPGVAVTPIVDEVADIVTQ
ncbi:hypothetical protein SAMN06269185_1564 [Natronoarchaeum philippinense]|uniref:Uncharacterized protein n=1 Tax=Natronoarchaeum philippinense TaxID=558529 RepID=A0A285NRX6_NATPI|nr:hypothetical protein [Natronoarchaeum philippinense]SNZ12235.1 hypothetical protein SAMN06269185_1564 [Natronoarchaeum philippinense]